MASYPMIWVTMGFKIQARELCTLFPSFMKNNSWRKSKLKVFKNWWLLRHYIRNHHYRSDSLFFSSWILVMWLRILVQVCVQTIHYLCCNFFFQLVCASVMIFACQTKVNVISAIQNLQTQKSSVMLIWPSANKFTFWKNY